MVKFELTEDTAVLIAVGIATVLVLGMVVTAAMQPKPVEHFFAIYVLGPKHMASGYPTKVRVGEPIYVYVGVYNSMGRTELVRVLIKVGANATSIPSGTKPSSAPTYATYERFLAGNETYEFEGPGDPVTIRLDKAGMNWELIFELWYFDEITRSYMFTGNWCQLWLNVTG